MTMTPPWLVPGRNERAATLVDGTAWTERLEPESIPAESAAVLRRPSRPTGSRARLKRTLMLVGAATAVIGATMGIVSLFVRQTFHVGYEYGGYYSAGP